MIKYSVEYRLSNGNGCYGEDFKAVNIQKALQYIQSMIESNKSLILNDGSNSSGAVIPTNHIIHCHVSEIKGGIIND